MQKFVNRTQYRQAEDIKRLKFICRQMEQLPPARENSGCRVWQRSYRLSISLGGQRCPVDRPVAGNH
jgi:hypothetical protein